MPVGYDMGSSVAVVAKTAVVADDDVEGQPVVDVAAAVAELCRSVLTGHLQVTWPLCWSTSECSAPKNMIFYHTFVYWQF